MKIDRLISIIMLLLERQKLSITELAAICEVTPRTISRDLETINQSGIPIISYMGSQGGVGIMESYKLEKRLFTTSDVTTLLMGLGCMRTSLSDRVVTDALAKVKGLIPEEQRQEIELRAGQMAIDMTSWTGSAGQTDVMKEIQHAMQSCLLLEFDYTDRLGQSTSRTVEPYRLLFKEMRWYLEAYCLERQDFRIFKLARIRGLQVTQTAFARRAYQPGPVLQPNFQDDNVVTTTLKVRASALEQLEDAFGPLTLQQADGEWMTVEIRNFNDARGYRFLCGLGTDCICIAPEQVRQGLLAYLQAMAEFYQA